MNDRNDDDATIDVNVILNFLTAAKYDEEDWQDLVQKVARGSGLSPEKAGLVLDTLHDYLLGLTQQN